MYRIANDLLELGKKTYEAVEQSLHELLTGETAMKIKIVRKCKNGNLEIKYFDQELNCWLQGWESEANIRKGIQEKVFTVENGEDSTSTPADDNSILALARRNANSSNRG